MLVLMLQGVLDRFSQIQPKVIFSVNAVHYNGKVHDHLNKLENVVQGTRKHTMHRSIDGHYPYNLSVLTKDNRKNFTTRHIITIGHMAMFVVKSFL